MSIERVKEILSWYPAITPQQKRNFEKILNFGRIGGSGKFVILPVDQGFEHGPARSFTSNPSCYDPSCLVELAVESGCNAYAAPLGQIEAAYDVIQKNSLPIILKVNNHDLMMPDDSDPKPAITSWVDDAVRLKCQAVGFTIYPGSVHTQEMYQKVRELVSDARKAGVIVVVWAYPRGSGIRTKEAETAVDVVSYAVHIAAQLGAHIIKCKPSTEYIGLESNVKKKIYDGLDISSLAARTKLIVQSAFNGKRVVICSGGDVKTTKDVLTEIRELKEGGAFGSIVGRNSFQRPRKEAVELLHKIQDIYVE